MNCGAQQAMTLNQGNNFWAFSETERRDLEISFLPRWMNINENPASDLCCTDTEEALKLKPSGPKKKAAPFGLKAGFFSFPI